MQTVSNQPGTSQQKKKPAYVNDTILESLRHIAGGIGTSVAKDVVAGTARDALTSLFGHPTGGDLRPHNTQEAAARERQPQPSLHTPEVYQPIRTVSVQEAGIREKIEAVRAELKALAASIKQLDVQIEQAIEGIPARPGVYHMTFLERLRSVIQMLRRNVADSQSWLALWTSRRKKLRYWGMYKKYGTSFGLSSERSSATQAG